MVALIDHSESSCEPVVEKLFYEIMEPREIMELWTYRPSDTFVVDYRNSGELAD